MTDERDDERRGEPVVLLPLVEHDLEAAEADGDERQADVVDAARLALLAATMCGGSVTTRLGQHSESRPTGTLMKKTQRHEKWSVMKPPSVGPMAGASTTAMP